MEEVNYIKHLNAVFKKFYEDQNLNPSDISLYMALFQIWNANRFSNEFMINREEVMFLSKIGSTSTYHRCIKKLNDLKYIIYKPSYNRYKGSKIQMIKIRTTDGTVQEKQHPKNEPTPSHYRTSPNQVMGHIYKHNKTYINNKHIKEENLDFNKIDEVSKHYSKACVERSRNIPLSNNLNVNNDKNYNEPL